jgi:hypothetical protein
MARCSVGSRSFLSFDNVSVVVCAQPWPKYGMLWAFAGLAWRMSFDFKGSCAHSELSAQTNYCSVSANCYTRSLAKHLTALLKHHCEFAANNSHELVDGFYTK